VFGLINFLSYEFSFVLSDLIGVVHILCLSFLFLVFFFILPNKLYVISKIQKNFKIILKLFLVPCGFFYQVFDL
jgi:hypothetical protein